MGKLKKNTKPQKTKIHLVFDEEKRKEFLTGFHKRKLQRKKKARDQLEKELKEEKKRLKLKAREAFERLTNYQREVYEMQDNIRNDTYETDEVTVEITELSTQKLAEENNWIGPNAPKYESESDDDKGDDEIAVKDAVIPGMEIKLKKEAIKQLAEFNSERDIKKALKKEATQNVKKSKAFQEKGKLNKKKQIKRSLQKKKLDSKVQKRKGFKKKKRVKGGGKREKFVKKHVSN